MENFENLDAHTKFIWLMSNDDYQIINQSFVAHGKEKNIINYSSLLLQFVPLLKQIHKALKIHNK